ncbi:hypothetical protein EDB84DRAFT_1567231 [Lactarius hengduanensis]|nr:hypothetical protein EDB84DRAFT_1567231 [Lactarius hengduanensis]
MTQLASKPLQPTLAPTGANMPPPAANEPSWLTGTALKAATEHLFATQRAKKPADRAKGKGGGRLSSTAMRNSTAAAMENVWAELWDARRDAGAPSEDGDYWPELPTPPPPPPLRATQDRCEVPLAAFVRPVKLRGAKAKESTEFEFLPPVKNVIALDDADSNVPDEPWEYISSAGGDDEARKIFSYAEIVSKSA